MDLGGPSTTTETQPPAQSDNLLDAGIDLLGGMGDTSGTTQPSTDNSNDLLSAFSMPAQQQQQPAATDLLGGGSSTQYSLDGMMGMGGGQNLFGQIGQQPSAQQIVLADQSELDSEKYE